MLRWPCATIAASTLLLLPCSTVTRCCARVTSRAGGSYEEHGAVGGLRNLEMPDVGVETLPQRVNHGLV